MREQELPLIGLVLGGQVPGQHDGPFWFTIQHTYGAFTLRDQDWYKMGCMGLCIIHADWDRYSDWCQWVSNTFYWSWSQSPTVWTQP